MPIYTPGKLVLSRIQQYPAIIGEAFGGGYFAGYISHTANGSPTHALIVAPKSGESGARYKTSLTPTSGTSSSYDGVANTAGIVAAGISSHPAAQFCVNLTIGGYTDWYQPARYELDIAYFNLKPGTGVHQSDLIRNDGNPYSVPRRTNNAASGFTINYPSQTSITDFQQGAPQAFGLGFFWSSGNTSGTASYKISFNNGTNLNASFTDSDSVRAFRRIALP